MKEFSIPMSLADFVPVLLFLCAAILLMRDLYGRMGRASFALFAAGSIEVTGAGALKALYKLLYAAGICDFEALNAIFFPTQSIGFLLAGLGLLLMTCGKKKDALTENRTRVHSFALLPVMLPLFAAMAEVPKPFNGTMLFVVLMVLGLGLMDVCLCIYAAGRKKAWVIPLLILSWVCSMGMGYLSSRDFTQSAMNWICEGINIVGQGALLAAVSVLHRTSRAD